MAYKIFLHCPDDTACSLYRAKLPFQHCYSKLSENNIYLNADVKAEGLYDSYIFSRLLRSNFYSEFITQIYNKKLVYQTDDDIWHIPDWNPSSRLLTNDDLQVTDYYINGSAKIVTSTQPLAELLNHPKKTLVLPNLIDTAHFSDKKRIGDKPLKILWCGSSSHHGDLEEIVEPIIKISEKYGDDVGIIFWGYIPAALGNFERVPGYPYAEIVPKYKNIFKGEWFNLNLYFDKLNQLEPDIAIIPLQDCQFNYSKSNLKWLEMTMAGAATIATDLPPYQSIRHNETGLLVKSSDDWYNALVELIDNKDLRLKIADNAKQQVTEEFSWQCSKKKLWEDFFLDLSK
jgi:O-antigen biosynthesis protein